MADIPLPQPCDIDFEAEHENWVWHEWHCALEWVKKGDFLPMAECFRRTDLPLNNDDVRAWLAEELSKPQGFKKPRKVTRRPEWVLFEMGGRQFYIDKRHLRAFEAMKLVRDGGLTVEDAAKRHCMTESQLKQHLARLRSYWGLQPKSRDGMFEAELAALKTRIKTAGDDR